MKRKTLYILAVLMMLLSLPFNAVAQDNPTDRTYELEVNGIKFKMIRVEGGQFKMTDQYIVTLSTYYICETEVTQELWTAVMKKNPSKNQGQKYPVESVSWNKVQKFLKELNKLTGYNFSLPTEAEWVYAAIGGKHSRGYVFSGSNVLNEVAWHQNNLEALSDYNGEKGSTQLIAGKITRPRIHDVATRLPNELGLYDMTGNVNEWCQDYFKIALPTKPMTNPTGPKEGGVRVYRGGGWNSTEETCAVSYRGEAMQSFACDDIGFRFVLRLQ